MRTRELSKVLAEKYVKWPATNFFITVKYNNNALYWLFNGDNCRNCYFHSCIYAGRYHASSPQKCGAISALMLFLNLNAIKYIPKLFYNHFAILTLIAGISIIMLSSVEDINKLLDDKEKIYYTEILLIIIKPIIISNTILLK